MRNRIILIALLSCLPWLAWASGGSCGSIPVPSGVTSCYYISKATGSDSNAGTTEATAWAHLPGMPSCAGTCSSTTPAAGEGFILRGGDTWVNADLDVWWQWSGSSGSPVYIGVDPTWYNSTCGSSSCRPIWTCGGATCSYTQNGAGYYTDWSGVAYVTLDNIEMTGLFSDSAGDQVSFVFTAGQHNNFQNLYLHGWSHASGASADGSVAFTGPGSSNYFHNNVIDGSDTSKDMLTAFFNGPDNVYNNVVKYVANGFEGGANTIHDNWFGPIVYQFIAGHQNAIQQSGPSSGNNVTVYNNIITQVADGGMGQLWVEQGSLSNPSLVTYVFDNVEFNTAAGNNVDICQLGTNCGTFYFFNNTFQCGNDTTQGGVCATPGGGGPTTVINWLNNHCIVTSGSCYTNNGVNVSFNITTPNVVQPIATANSQGYSSTSTYALQPTSGSGSTVGAGTNQESLCTTIAASDALAGAACKNETGYACSYNTTNHTVNCPAIASPVVRPSSGAWDIGAYQFSGAAPAAPGVSSPVWLMVAVR